MPGIQIKHEVISISDDDTNIKEEPTVGNTPPVPKTGLNDISLFSNTLSVIP